MSGVAAVCNTGAMAQLAGSTSVSSKLANVLHQGSTPAVYVYSYTPETVMAFDSVYHALNTGTLTSNASATLTQYMPTNMDLVSGCSLILNVPAIVNVSSGTCDIAGSATNASVDVPKVRAYISGAEADHATRDRQIVLRAATSAGTSGSNPIYIPMAAVPTGVKEGDWFEAVAQTTPQTGVTGTLTFPANGAVTTSIVASTSYTGVILAGYASSAALTLVFNASGFVTPALNVSVPVTFGGVVGILSFGAAGVSYPIDPFAGEAVTATFVPLSPSKPLFGRVGRIDGSNVYDRGAASISKIGGFVYDVVFSRDTNLNAYVGDSSVEIPESDPAAQFTKFYDQGPNIPAATAQGLLCPAAGLKSDIAAYFQPWAPVHFIKTATLKFGTVCVDTITGVAIQIYYDLFTTPCEKNARVLNACADIRMLKARARLPQQFEVPLPFSFFTSLKRAIQMERFANTQITMQIVTNAYSRMIGNGCGTSDFVGLTITSDNALGGTTPRTLVTKAGAQDKFVSTNAFCDSKVALAYDAAKTIDASDIRVGLRWIGMYLTKKDRETLNRATPKHMIVQQHVVGTPVSITTSSSTTVNVPGSNAITGVTLVTQLQSSINQGRDWDFGGHAIGGTGTQSGAFVQREPIIQSIQLKCQNKARTAVLSAEDVKSIALAQGVATNVAQTTEYATFGFGHGPPDGATGSSQSLNAQTIPSIVLNVITRGSIFNDNSASGGLNGKSGTVALGSSIVDGGEVVIATAYTTQLNVLQFDQTSVKFQYTA